MNEMKVIDAFAAVDKFFEEFGIDMMCVMLLQEFDPSDFYEDKDLTEKGYQIHLGEFFLYWDQSDTFERRDFTTADAEFIRKRLELFQSFYHPQIEAEMSICEDDNHNSEQWLRLKKRKTPPSLFEIAAHQLKLIHHIPSYETEADLLHSTLKTSKVITHKFI
jgi:hypothetical protein